MLLEQRSKKRWKIKLNNKYCLLIYKQTVEVSSTITLIGKMIISSQDKPESHP